MLIPDIAEKAFCRQVARHIKLLQDLQLDKLVEEFGGLFSLKLLNRLALFPDANSCALGRNSASAHTHTSPKQFFTVHLQHEQLQCF